MVTADAGENRIFLAHHLQAKTPGSFLQPAAIGGMGYAIPAALALKLLHPKRPVVAVCGDGGFAMTMAELETAVRMELPVIAVVLVDDALSQIKAAQERKGYSVTGTTFRGLDYVAIAKGFGAVGYDVSTVAECRDAFAAAREAKGPVLVAAHVDPTAYRLD